MNTYNIDMQHRRVALTGAAFLILSACVGPRKKAPAEIRAEDRETVKEALGSEVSLKEDREKFSEFRKDIPPEKQKSNDELALFLNLMRQGNENPNQVRDKFRSLVHNKRSTFREKAQRLREDYRKEETRRRDDFMDGQKKQRESYFARKRSPTEVRRFYADQDKERAQFFSDERDRRQNFEAEMNAQSKDFDSYMRERQKEFDEQYRLYTKKYSERPKDKKAATGDEFKRLDEAPASPLGTED